MNTLPLHIVDLHGDVVNPYLKEIRAAGYQQVFPVASEGSLTRAFHRLEDRWDIRIEGGPVCAGDSEYCYGRAPEGFYLCHPCQGITE